MIIEVVGWIGSILVIIAYALTVKTKNGHLKLCNYLNFIGAILVGYNCYENQAFPSFILNIVWVAIAALGIIESLKVKKNKT